MARSALCLSLATALAFAALPSRAAAAVSLAVTRDAGAAQCPDEGEVRRLAEASRVPSEGAPAHAYRIAFTRAHGTYRAEIVDATASRVRAVEDRGPACAPLGQAVAVVLATMWSSEQEEARPESSAPQPSAAKAPAPQPAPQPVPPPPDDRETSRAADEERAPSRAALGASRFVFAAGSGIATGLVRPAAPVIVADAAIERAPIALAIGGLWIPRQQLSLAPGSVGVQLVAASARACAFAGRPARLGACARAFAGALTASARGFDATSDRTRPWLAAGLEAFVEGPLPIALLRYRAAASAIVPLHAERFTVANEGSAYDTPAIGGLFTLAIEIAR